MDAGATHGKPAANTLYEDSDDEDINLYIRAKSKNRLTQTINCFKEVIYIVLIFMIIVSQLYTPEALKLGQEIKYRFDLELPDYVTNAKPGFQGVQSFQDFYNWVDAVLLRRFYMDPFYPDMVENASNWSTKGSSPLTQNFRLLQSLSTEDDGSKGRSYSEFSPSNGGYFDQMYSHSEQGPAQAQQEELDTLNDARRRSAMFMVDKGSLFEPILARQKKMLEKLMTDYELAKQDLSTEEELQELEDLFISRRNKLLADIQDSEAKLAKRIETRSSSKAQKTFIGDHNVPHSKFLQTDTSGTASHRNDYFHRLLLDKSETVTIKADMQSLYYPQFLATTKSPLYVNKLVTSIHFRSRLRIEQSLGSGLPSFLSQVLDTGQSKDMRYPFVADERSYVYDLNIYGKTFDQARDELKTAFVTNGLINNRSFEMEASFGILNSNTNMLSNVNLYVRSSSTGIFQQSFNITSIRYNPYVYSTDKVRALWELIAIAFLIIMILQDVWRIVRNIASLKIHLKPPPEEGRSKFRIWFSKFWRKVFQILSKFLFGFFNYLKDFGTLLSFTGMILSVVISVYWFTYLARLAQMHDLDFSNPKNDTVMIRAIVLLRTITDSFITYRKISGLLIGIYFLRLIIIIFELFPRLSYSWRCVINSLLNNCYFLFFLFMINMGVTLFAHFYFGGRLEICSTMFSSFVVIFATILGYTDGITQMLDLEPVGATIALEAYYFLVIMILINMFIIFVNTEYKKLEEERELKEEQARRTQNPLDYTPFFIYQIQEQWKRLISYKIYSVFNRKKFVEMRELRKTERLMKSLQDKGLGDKNWDIEFQRFVDIDFKTNNSLGIITKITHSEIEELLKNKQFNYYWKFLALLLLLVLHMIMVAIIYSPLQLNYRILMGKLQIVLGQSLQNNPTWNGKLSPIPYSDLHMRVVLSEMVPYMMTNGMPTIKPLQLFQVYFPTPALQPVGNIIFSFENVEVVKAQYVSDSINQLAAYRYMDYSKSRINQLSYLSKLPATARDFQMSFSMDEVVTQYSNFNPPPFDYKTSKSGDVTRTVALIDSKLDFTDPYFIKLVGDNVVGPETKSVSAKTILYNKATEYYEMVEILMTKTYGDLYDIYFEYSQIPKTSILLSGGLGLPISMLLKFVIFFGLIYYTAARIKNSFSEYEIWYKIRITNELPAYLLHHRHRKMPEILRKLSSIIGLEDILMLISSGIYAVFFVSLIATAAAAESFKKAAETAAKTPSTTLEAYDKAQIQVQYKFTLDVLAGIEVFVLTIQVLMSMRRLKMFRVIMQSFSIILDTLSGLLVLMILILFGFSFMMHILLGEKYKEFENPFYIHRLTGILISFKQLVVYTDNFDTFITLVFMLPYFLMVKFTMLYLVIAVIYNSIGKAQKEVESKEVYTTRYLTTKEFFQRTMQKISKNSLLQREDKYGQSNTAKFVNTLNFNTHVEVFNRLIDSIHFTEGKNDITSWKKLLGEATVAEFVEREKITNKHQELVFHLLNFTVQNRKNFFVAAKEMAVSETAKTQKTAVKPAELPRQGSFHEKSQEKLQALNQLPKAQRAKEYDAMLKRLLNFYKSFFNYFRYGHNRLLKQMSSEYANIEANKKALESKEADEQSKNMLKSEIAQLHEKVEKLVAKSLVYWRILKTQKEESLMQEKSPVRSREKKPTVLPMDLGESSPPESPKFLQRKNLRD